MRTKPDPRRNFPLDLDERDFRAVTAYEDRLVIRRRGNFKIIPRQIAASTRKTVHVPMSEIDKKVITTLRANARQNEIIVRLMVPNDDEKKRRRTITRCREAATLEVRDDDARTLAEMLTELVRPVAVDGEYDVFIDDECVKLHVPLVNALSTRRLKSNEASSHTMDIVVRKGRFELARIE
jgi:hypothetical protein